MRSLLRPSLVCLAVLLLGVPLSAQTAGAQLVIAVPAAKKKKTKHAPDWVPPTATPAPEPSSLPAEAAPVIDSAAPPSVSLQPFLDTHLDKILTPLGSSAFAQSELITGMRANYAQGFVAASDARKSAYRSAVILCNAMTDAIGERQKAVEALKGSYATRSSESVQPRGGSDAVKKAGEGDAFFYNSQKASWTQRTTILRQGIVTLYQRERAAESQAGTWTMPSSDPAESAVAAATPAVSSPLASTVAAQDPVVGQWMLEGRSPLTLGADNSIQRSRAGTWRYSCTTDGGRNYELHWSNRTGSITWSFPATENGWTARPGRMPASRLFARSCSSEAALFTILAGEFPRGELRASGVIGLTWRVGFTRSSRTVRAGELSAVWLKPGSLGSATSSCGGRAGASPAM